MKIIRAIKIDVEKRSIYEIQMPNHLGGIYSAVNCTVYGEVRFEEKYCVLVDDEGAINGTEKLFSIDGNLFFGNGVIVGLDFENATYADCTMNVNDIEKRIKFYKAVPVE